MTKLLPSVFCSECEKLPSFKACVCTAPSASFEVPGVSEHVLSPTCSLIFLEETGMFEEVEELGEIKERSGGGGGGESSRILFAFFLRGFTASILVLKVQEVSNQT